jgi:hypothetical protein
LSVSSSSSQPSAPPIALDFARLSTGELRLTADGWHAVLQFGGVAHRLWMKELPPAGALHVLELPMDSSFELRARAAQSLWRTLGGRPCDPPLKERSLQQRQRFAMVLRALDARNEGLSYRAIAEGLFGRKRIPDRAWKTHDLRNRTIRLVQRGLALMRGGYRELLRPRDKDK